MHFTHCLYLLVNISHFSKIPYIAPPKVGLVIGNKITICSSRSSSNNIKCKIKICEKFIKHSKRSSWNTGRGYKMFPKFIWDPEERKSLTIVFVIIHSTSYIHLMFVLINFVLQTYHQCSASKIEQQLQEALNWNINIINIYWSYPTM